MRQQEKKDSSIVSLALWLALATTPMAATVLVSAPMLAQSTPETPAFSLPQTVENGTTVRIDGSSSLAVINQGLKENFEKQFSGTKVEIAANGTDAALKALSEGKIDIAAIGRGLTPKEKAQGLEQVRLRREKIAIIVSTENPFKQSLTSRQFARIFRGTVTDWSQLGGTAGKIRLIDRPTTSDTRENFRDYPAFKVAKFATGSNATQVAEDNTAEIVKQLGKDGISYVLANQVSKLQGVRVLKLHQTLPDDPKYPFSQPLVYAYKKNPSPGVASFLGFTIAPPGQKAIEQARTSQAEAIAASLTPTATQPTPAATTSPSAATTPAPNATALASQEPFVAPATVKPVVVKPIVDRETPFWLLLPLFITGVGALLLWWFLGRRPLPTEKTDDVPESTPNPPSPEARVTATSNTIVTPPVKEAIASGSARASEGANTIAQTPSNGRENYTQATSNLTQKATNGASNLEGTTPVGTNGSGILTGAAALTGAGVALKSGISENGRQTKPANQTTNTSAVDRAASESGDVAWDIEAPAAVVNTPYPQLPSIPEEAANVELPSPEVTDSIGESPNVSGATTNPGTAFLLPELPEISDLTSDIWDLDDTEEPTEEELQAESNWLENTTPTEDTVSTDDTQTSILFNIYGKGSERETTEETQENSIYTELASLDSTDLSAIEVTASPANLSEESFNLVADTAEPTADLPEELSQAESTPTADITDAHSADLASAATLAAGAGIVGWAATPHGVEETSELDIPAETQTPVDNLPVVEETATLQDINQESSIVLIATSSTSANISWQISNTTKQALRQQGGSQLVVRLYDVTGIDLSYQSPQLVQQYEWEEGTQEHSVAIPVSDRDYIAEIGYVTDDNRWLLIARSTIVRVFSPVNTDNTVENASLLDETAVSLVDADEENSIVLTPSSSTSADVSWEISDTTKQALRQQGGSHLILRLYDVTGIDLSYQAPQLLQQYECEETRHDGYVIIPVSDRDYMTEIGYLTDDDRWLFIARSAIVRIFGPVDDTTAENPSLFGETATDLVTADTDTVVENASLFGETSADLVTADTDTAVEDTSLFGESLFDLVNADTDTTVENASLLGETAVDLVNADKESSIVLIPRTPKWAYVSWYVSDSKKEALRQQGGSQLVIRLYDVTEIDLSYQSPMLIQQYECEDVTNDRFVAIPVSDRDYITEIGYVTDDNRWLSIARSAIVRVFSRPNGDFWFVADAELIIHGATQPNTNVTIGSHSIKIKPDGTFHLRIPFSDGLIDYPITVAANGEDTKTIHKKFSQETSES
jgi:phosphate transport system substrate-binding protein